MTGALEFAQATDLDWPLIWPVFREVIAGGDTYAFPPDMDEVAARAAWMLPGGRSVTYLAKLDGAVIATAILRPNAVGLGDHIANAAWMVSGSVRGRGVGRQFAELVIAEAKRLGFGGMQFNAVVATNEPAIELWQSLGFTIVGTVPHAFRHAALGPTAIHIMYRNL